MRFLQTMMEKLPEFLALEKALKKNAFPVEASGLSVIHKSAVIAALCMRLKKHAVIIAPDESEAVRLSEDLTAMGIPALFYPARDFSLRNAEGVSHEYEHQRLQVLSRMVSGDWGAVTVCPDAALQYTLPPSEVRRRTMHLAVGEIVAPEIAVETLIRCGFERTVQVEGPGQFSLRGGILDVYTPEAPAPIRAEFWGDEIDTLSYFDPETQRRTEEAPELVIGPSAEALLSDGKALAEKIEEIAAGLKGKNAGKARTILQQEADSLRNDVHLGSLDKYITLLYEEGVSTLLDYAGDDSILFLSEAVRSKERVRSTLWQWGEDVKDLLEEGVLCRELTEYSEDWSYLLSRIEKQGVYLDTFARGTSETPLREAVAFTARQLSPWGGSMQLLEEDLQNMLHTKWSCVVLAGSEKIAKTTAEDLAAKGFPAAYMEDPETIQRGTVAVLPGVLSGGMEFPGAFYGVISHGKLMATATKKLRRPKNGQMITSLSELTPGDYVVHSSHGVGVFEGIHKLDLHGVVKDYIKVRYAKSDVLYVPVTQLDLVSKYIGPKEDTVVKLNRLGGTEWQKAKTKVRKAVRDIAKELIALYAARMETKGHAFPEDTDWQRDFEAHFEYEETEDQLRCIDEIKTDMEREAPMDRLLCGDVGFGKTEVALRAAFKCIADSKQCAILVPTTILAWQHYQTILRRMEGFPVKVELLSRFRTPKQQEEILRQLRRGEVDVVVGTHRLVSKDVQFRDLGLVVIDEEQRFGVAQKERLKDVCKNVDVLTLSATPIPRTLNMALSGIRDMSVLEEAPQDRHPVQTYVLEHDDGILYDAIRREMRRGGQVYWLHNDVASIEGVATRIQNAIPEARVGFGHGKMSEQELSEIWRKLIDYEIDVLVCTTIIETGVDVPNANTLIIDNADRMGLSQLHQIRGRVGRSNRRAYAYFTFTRNKVLTDIAQKRLSAIREFTEFGSGFKIAMRDLELRGAGNILGGEQHGHMEAVGYDLYLKLLNEAVVREKEGLPPAEEKDCLIDVQLEAHIPEKYIADLRQRLEIYRRIADIRNVEDSMDVTDELIDRFGEPPESVSGLIEVALLRNRASALGIYEVKQKGDALLLYGEKFDMKQVGVMVSNLKRRVMVNAGAKPYISVKLAGKPLDTLNESLNLLENAQSNA